MTYDLFVYGVPNGFDSWKAVDRDYFGTFYGNNKSEKVRYLIQTRPSNGQPYCYYNYLVYDNVVSADGRSGSFFGITLRLDAYYNKVQAIYSLLDMLYHSYILGKVLTAAGNNLKYTISSFRSVDAQMKAAEEETGRILGELLRANVTTITWQMHSGSGMECNLYDLSDAEILEQVQSRGSIALSPYYSSQRERATERQCTQQISAAQEEYQRQLQARDDEHTKTMNAINSALATERTTSQQHQQQIAQLSQKLQQMQSESAKRGKTQEIGQLVAQVREPIQRLAAAFAHYVPQPEQGKKAEGQPIQWKKWLPFINLCLLVVVIIILAGTGISNTSKERQIVQLSQTVEQLQQQNKALQEEIDYLNSPRYNYDAVDLSGVRLDIYGYSGKGPLTVGRGYTVTAIGGVDGATWEAENATVVETSDPNKILLTPTAASVVIVYRVGNAEQVRVIPQQ